MRLTRKLTLLALAALVAAGAAWARAPHDPQERLTARDNAAARALVVRKSDLAGAWKATKAAPDSDETCKAFDPDLSDLTLTGKAQSPDFTRADGVSVSSEAEVYATAAQMRQSFDRTARPALARCFDEAFRSGAQGATVKTLKARKAAAPRYGERTAHYEFGWSVTQGANTLRVNVDAWLVGKGRNGLTILFFSAPAPVAPAAQRELVRAVASRL